MIVRLQEDMEREQRERERAHHAKITEMQEQKASLLRDMREREKDFDERILKVQRQLDATTAENNRLGAVAESLRATVREKDDLLRDEGRRVEGSKSESLKKLGEVQRALESEEGKRRVTEEELGRYKGLLLEANRSKEGEIEALRKRQADDVVAVSVSFSELNLPVEASGAGCDGAEG